MSEDNYIPTIYLLNGPPRSGKDTLAKQLEESLFALHLKLVYPLRKASMAFFDAVDYEVAKTNLHSVFCRNLREFMIDLSDKYIKPVYGKLVFVELLWREIQKHETEANWLLGPPFNYVISDCGFQHEYEYFLALEKQGLCNVVLVHLVREGCSFANDKRNYIDPITDNFTVVHNNGSLSGFANKFHAAVGKLPANSN